MQMKTWKKRTYSYYCGKWNDMEFKFNDWI